MKVIREMSATMVFFFRGGQFIGFFGSSGPSQSTTSGSVDDWGACELISVEPVSRSRSCLSGMGPTTSPPSCCFSILTECVLHRLVVDLVSRSDLVLGELDICRALGKRSAWRGGHGGFYFFCARAFTKAGDGRRHMRDRLSVASGGTNRAVAATRVECPIRWPLHLI